MEYPDYLTPEQIEAIEKWPEEPVPEELKRAHLDSD